MDLKTFISESIKDIFDGVIEAQDYAKKKGGKVNVYQHDSIRKIEYDIAVTASKSKVGEAKAKAKIFVVEANLGGEVRKEDSTVSRIKFIIPVELPNKEFIVKNERKGSDSIEPKI
jgi:hypothetical protein